MGLGDHVRHSAGVLVGLFGVTLLLASGLSTLAVSLPFLVCAAISLGVWKVFWTPVYRHLYLRHLGWAHLKFLEGQGCRLPLKWEEVARVPLPDAAGGDARTARVFSIVNLQDNYAWLVVETTGSGSYAAAAAATPPGADDLEWSDPGGDEGSRSSPANGGAERIVSACVVDVGSAGVVARAIVDISISAFEGRVVPVTAILTTHHHWDHMGGNKTLLDLLKAEYVRRREELTTPDLCRLAWWGDGAGGRDRLAVFASSTERVLAATRRVRDGDVVRVPGTPAAAVATAGGGAEAEGPPPSPSLAFEVIEVPSHTDGHVMFLLRAGGGGGGAAAARSALFSGDTVFNGGGGAVFEGSEREMAQNHATVLERCPRDCAVYSGHEYGEGLLRNEMLSGRVLERPAAFFHAASAFYVAHHKALCAHPSTPVPTIEQLLPLNDEFRRVRDAALAVLLSVHFALAEGEEEEGGDQEQGGGGDDAPPPAAAPADPAPWTDSPFTTLCTRDLEALEKKLGSGELSAADAAGEVRRLRGAWAASARGQDEVAGVHDRLDTRTVARAYVLVGASSSREAQAEHRAAARAAEAVLRSGAGQAAAEEPVISLQRIADVAEKLPLNLRVDAGELLARLWVRIQRVDRSATSPASAARSPRGCASAASFTAVCDESPTPVRVGGLPCLPLSTLLRHSVPKARKAADGVAAADFPTEEALGRVPPFDLRFSLRETCPICPSNGLHSC